MIVENNAIIQSLEAQDHTPITDQIARRRDETGQPQPRVILYHEPVQGLAKSDQCAEGLYLQQVEQKNPFFGAKLKAFHDDKLNAAYQGLRDVDFEAREEVAQRQRESEARDLEIDEAVEMLQAEKKTELAPLREGLARAVSGLNAAREEAAKACGRVGVGLTDQTDAGDILAIPKLTQAEAADRLGLPLDPEKPFYVKLLKAVATVLMGVTFGFSAGVVSGAINTDQLAEQTSLLAVASLVGAAASALIVLSVGKAFYEVALASNRQRSLLERFSKTAAANVVLLAMLAGYALMDKEGIMKLATLNGSNTSELVGLVVGGLLGVGYILFNAYDGYQHGRKHTVQTRVEAACAQADRERFEARRDNPLVQAAIASVGQLRRAEAEYAQAAQALALAEAPFQARLAQLESRRLPRPAGKSAEQLKRLQDAHMQYVGAQHEYELLKADVEDVILCKNGLQRFFRKLARKYHRRRING